MSLRCVSIVIRNPRPSRPLNSAIEPLRAMDFEVELRVGADPFGGSITLIATGTSWSPRRSPWDGPWDGTEEGWVHGGLPAGIDAARTAAGPEGDRVGRRVLSALSGEGWPQNRWATPSSEGWPQNRWARDPGFRVEIQIGMDDVLVGDVVRHLNSGRIGSVLEVGRAHADGTIEYRIQLARDARKEDLSVDEVPLDDEIWWNSRRIVRVPRRDPYRRYLAMREAEDSPERKIRRARHRGHRSGGLLHEAAWDHAYWQLSNLQHRGPAGELTYRNLGRAHWERAAQDCLDRRDRSALVRDQIHFEGGSPIPDPGGAR